MHAGPAGCPAPAPWTLTAAVESRVEFPGGVVLVREDFHAWLWERAAGLIGIDEGAVTAAEAAARGLVPAELIIDAAEAPADRDWVAALAVAVEAWWFSDEASARDAVDLVAGVRGCVVRGLRAEAEEDRAAAARTPFGPISVPGFGVVRPSWEEGVATVTDDGFATVFIEPGLGFGTGLHETTQLCLAALADGRRRGGRLARVLDHGSGSGILGIAAAVLGASRVDAVEIDARVHAAIRANADRNGVAERIHVTAGLPAEPAAYDLVMANIVAPVLLRLADQLCARVHPHGGALVLSGLLAGDVAGVAERYSALLGARPVAHQLGIWSCLVFDRP